MEAFRSFLLTPSPVLCKLYQGKRKNTRPVVTVSTTDTLTITAVDPNIEEDEKTDFKIVQETALDNICK